MTQVQRIKLELDRRIEEFKIKMSHCFHELEQRILEISKKQTEIVTMINNRKREMRLSEPKSPFYSRDTLDQVTPAVYIQDKPKLE
jgi:hypothetical protein